MTAGESIEILRKFLTRLIFEGQRRSITIVVCDHQALSFFIPHHRTSIGRDVASDVRTASDSIDRIAILSSALAR